MKKLTFRYQVNYTFSSPVTDHSFALRILPETNEEQGIYASGYEISGGNSLVNESAGLIVRLTSDEPAGEGGSISGLPVGTVYRLQGSTAPGRDGFGNGLITGRIPELHDRMSFIVTGTAYTHRDSRGKGEERPHPMYRYATDLTRPGPELRNCYEENRRQIREIGSRQRGLPGGESWGRALEWMRLVQASMTYAPGVTDIRTTAEAAWRQRQGVCQDYTHVLLALLRLDGIPARYKAGLLIGEGATHAWAEAWCEGAWRGLDPTHGCWLTDDYIEICTGRDYRDCIMDRGCFRGCALQQQEVHAQVRAFEPGTVEPLRIL